MVNILMSAAALIVAFLVPGSAAWAAPTGNPWGEDYFPNVPLVTQDGQTVRFYDDLMKNKKVLINFVFTSCEQACPLDTAKMAQVQKMLGDRVGKDYFMYSITLDPEHDTPQVLKEYAEKFGAGPGWLFLSGKREDIDKVRAKLGETGAMEEHANTVKAGDVSKGRWIRLPLGGDARQIVIEVKNTLSPGWYAGLPAKSIAEAKRTELSGPGQILFNNRCSACHGFGKGDQLGPDLKGVTQRRDRAWLARFLMAPEKMRASKDPIAVDLASRYKVLMPNLSLTNKNLEDVMAYLEAMNAPPAKSGAPKAEAAPAAVETAPAKEETAPAAADGAKQAAAHDHHDHSHHHHQAGGEK